MNIADYRINRLDKVNWKLEHYAKVTNPKTGQTRMEWQAKGYFGKLEHILDFIIDSKLEGSGARGLKQSVKALRSELAELRSELLKELFFPDDGE